MGVWLEVATLLIPGRNDKPQELRELARFLVSISADIPWHVSRFHSHYRLMDVAPTPQSTLETAIEIGREEGLRYIYAGNTAGHVSECTFCPECGAKVVERIGFDMRADRSVAGCCPRCGAVVAGLGLDEQMDPGRDASEESR
jgi:pyruvate formate lyase activating enzyme